MAVNYSPVEVFQIEKVKSFVDDVAFYCTEADISYKFDNFKLTGHDKSCELALTLKDDLSKMENYFSTYMKDIEEIITSYEYYVKNRRTGHPEEALVHESLDDFLHLSFSAPCSTMIYSIQLRFNRDPMVSDVEYDV